MTDGPLSTADLHAERMTRKLGWVLVVIGAFLLIIMLVLTLLLGDLRPVRPGQSGFTGTAEQARQIHTLFALVAAIGLTSLVGGIYQIKKGQRNIAVMAVFVILFVALMLTAKKFMP